MTDSRFGYVTSVLHIKKRGLFDMNVIKKNDYWTKHMESQEAIDEMQGQGMRTIRTCKGTVHSEIGNFYMVVLVDSTPLPAPSY